MPAPACSDEDFIRLWNEADTALGLAKRLGIGERAVMQRRRKIEKRLGIKLDAPSIRDAEARRNAMQGWAPGHDMTHTVPSPFVVKGVSTYYDKDGQPAGQWVKSRLDDSQAEDAIRAYVKWLTEDARGLSPVARAPRRCMDDLLAVYPMGDPHFGMYAWAAEAGEDFDLRLAEDLTTGAIDRLVASAPPAGTAILLPLGDFFHADDQTNQTPGHKHQLDVDSRYPKVLTVGIKAMHHAILRLAQKHLRVVVRIEPGNHDPHAKWALTLALAAYFENHPRVEIDTTPAKFWYYRFGKVLIGSTHGDTVKHNQLLGVMASDRHRDWGETQFRYWYTGHVHNNSTTELAGVVCESFRTLAARDAYATGHGYRAGRDMCCIVHHRDHGEIERHRCDISMLRDEAA